MKVAECATARNLCEQPAFSWWVTNVLKRHKKIIAAANTKYIKQTHPFGLEGPRQSNGHLR